MTPPEASQPAAITGQSAKSIKYTMLLSAADALLWDQVLMQVRVESGRRVDKSELLRILVALTAGDAAVRARVVAEIQEARS